MTTQKQPTKSEIKAKTREVLDTIAKADADMLVWAEQVVAMTPEGDILDLGLSNQYRVYHANKTLVLQNPEIVYKGDLKLLHRKVVELFAAIGWKVSEGTA